MQLADLLAPAGNLEVVSFPCVDDVCGAAPVTADSTRISQRFNRFPAPEVSKYYAQTGSTAL